MGQNLVMFHSQSLSEMLTAIINSTNNCYISNLWFFFRQIPECFGGSNESSTNGPVSPNLNGHVLCCLLFCHGILYHYAPL